MRKKRTTFIVLLVLSGLSFVAAIVSFTAVANLNLKKTHSVVGPVKDAYITERLIRGMKYNQPQTVFCFEVFNSSPSFAIHMPNGRYGNLEREIRKGDTLKVFFSPSAERFNMDVYQVEGKRGVVYDAETYKKNTTNKAGYMVIGGVLILAIAFLTYTEFNIFKFLMRLTTVL